MSVFSPGMGSEYHFYSQASTICEYLSASCHWDILTVSISKEELPIDIRLGAKVVNDGSHVKKGSTVPLD